MFFVCKECSGNSNINLGKANTEQVSDQLNGTAKLLNKTITIPESISSVTQVNQNSTEILSSLEKMISDKVSKIEENLMGLLTTKLGENKKEISALNDNLQSRVPTPAEPSTQSETSKTWSSVVAGESNNLKSVIRDARNDEKIEHQEKVRRSKNLIIHGAEEIGADEEEIKNEDTVYVKEIFNKIGLKYTPTNVSRLGKSDSKMRPIKVVMKTTKEKNRIMDNLYHLKGTERFFGKISIKDDYTIGERDEIRLLTERAKQQGTQNPERVFKVRGNSKNGWRIVSYLRN